VKKKKKITAETETAMTGTDALKTNRKNKKTTKRIEWNK
jgi:hypothetical protein